ncbi:serine hydrolase [Vitiosangium sp. GDMCC 1.1324]|uniref:serine hydrolase domain-containing protein n=1 Tax=Vitiosangium sp. (strain GDMCC 1.1324) TaxID=2138576 RepID=UPI000D38CDB1|nr:serine hydrolase domain-containing protein [Vitiosangium sp. GDMCC 1.1324]PTL81654.1 serine hydrolase [Vitiosangium sp. GDMCC 1.1324]
MPSAIANLSVDSPPNPSVAEDHALSVRLDEVIHRALTEKRIVGTVVLVARDGRVVYQRAAGSADREAGRPMRENELFRLASITKVIVSAAALALVEQHQLQLEDPVTRWLPDFRPKLEDGREPVITVRHLMTHTAGLTYRFREPAHGPYHRARISEGLDQPGLSMEEHLRRIVSVPLSYVPGTSWGYSVATDVLGAVIARAGGASLPEVVERLVTRPLGMSDTAFSVKDVARLATPYADGHPEPVRMGESHTLATRASTVTFVPGRVFDPRSFPSGGGGMVGSAGDILKFLETLRMGGAPVLGASTVEQLTTAHVGPEAESWGPGWGFGLGVGILVDPAKAGSPQSAGTWQWGGSYGHTWFVDPKHRLTVVALTNTASEGVFGAFPVTLRDAIYGAGR